MQNSVQLYAAGLRRDTARLVSDEHDDEHYVVDGIKVRVETLEADLFVQSVQMRNVSELDGLKH